MSNAGTPKIQVYRRCLLIEVVLFGWIKPQTNP